MDMIQTLAQELNKDPRHVENVVRLLDEGNTIPFIARYRKELHGAMDDTSLRTLEERLRPWQRWRISTAPTSRNAAPAPP